MVQSSFRLLVIDQLSDVFGNERPGFYVFGDLQAPSTIIGRLVNGQLRINALLKSLIAAFVASRASGWMAFVEQEPIQAFVIHAGFLIALAFAHWDVRRGVFGRSSRRESFLYFAKRLVGANKFIRRVVFYSASL